MSGEKTEKATAKRRRDARKKGNVLMSKELVLVASLLAMFFAIKNLMPQIFASCGDCIRYFLTLDSTHMTMDGRQIERLLIKCAVTFVIAALPLLLTSCLVAVVSTMAQTRMLFSSDAFSFKMERLDPIKGFLKLFSLRGVMELFKSTFKIIILGWILYKIYLTILPVLPHMMDMETMQAVTYIGDSILTMVFQVTIAFAFLAGVDYLYQWWQYEKNMRMSKQEIKDEFKQAEGDPQVKGHIRQLQQQRARQRMMQKVPTADVVIRNPTHFAVAIAYQKDKNRAPMVVAKGMDELALRIIAIAEANGVHIVEDKPLARALHAEVDLDQEIPEKFYQPIAKVLAFVYSLQKKEMN